MPSNWRCAPLFRERVADAAPPVGDLVVVEYDDGDDPPVLSEVQAEPNVQPLTPRELEVLRLMALGWKNEYVAAELGVCRLRSGLDLQV